MVQINTMLEAVTLYRKIEGELEAKDAAHEANTVKERRALEQIALGIKQMLIADGVRSMNIPGVAEAKIVTKRVFGCADWDLFQTWLVQNNKPELLQQRIHDGNMQAWINERNGQELPPAINVHSVDVLKLLKGKE